MDASGRDRWEFLREASEDLCAPANKLNFELNGNACAPAQALWSLRLRTPATRFRQLDSELEQAQSMSAFCLFSSFVCPQTSDFRLLTSSRVGQKAFTRFLLQIISLSIFRKSPTVFNMRLPHLLITAVVALCGITLVHAQSPTPEASASPTKHRSHKKTEAKAEASPAASETTATESSTATPAPKKRSHKKEEAAMASPSPAAADATTAPSAGASPAAKRSHKKTENAAAAPAAAAPAVTPVPSATPGIIGSFFKHKSTPAPVAPAPAASSKTPAAATTNTTATAPAPGGGNGQVWVNSETHVYHKEGSRYYGKTKKGKYMSEAEAMKEGDRSAKKGD
jgi:hypothetical protein